MKKIKALAIKALLGKDFAAVKGALEFSAYTHNRRGEHSQRDDMNAVINRIGMADVESGK